MIHSSFTTTTPPPPPRAAAAAVDDYHYLESVREVDREFQRGAVIVVVVWLALLAVTTTVTPTEKFERMEGIELTAASFAFLFLLLSILGRLVELNTTTTWKKKKKNKLSSSSSSDTTISGVLIGSFTVQIVALLTNGIFASGIPVPVLRDPFFGNRVFIYRWCEWTPLAFYMTFLTSGVDADNSIRESYLLGLSQGLSTLMGLFLPYCSNTNWQWGSVMTICCILYGFMFPALHKSRKRYHSYYYLATTTTTLQTNNANANNNTSGGGGGISSSCSSAYRKEIADRSRLSFQLLSVCTVAWTALVVMYFIAGVGYRLRGTTKEQQHTSIIWTVVQQDWFSMVWESVMDVILKNLYMNVILQVHTVAFDDGARAERRLGELRRLMGAVWERSSDVICVSVRNRHHHAGIPNNSGSNNNSSSISTMVSPVYLQCYHHCDNDDNAAYAETAILFDMDETMVDAQLYDEIEPKTVRAIDFKAAAGDIMSPQAFPSSSSGKLLDTDDLDPILLKSLATLIARSWNTTNNNNNQKQQQQHTQGTTITQGLLKKTQKQQQSSSGQQQQHQQYTLTNCEANICHLEEDDTNNNNAILLIVRDISERSKRFEAEKKMIIETVAREKDAEVNRFTRHEVKNGLLAAIGLCEGLKEQQHSTSSSNSSSSSTRTCADVVTASINNNSAAVDNNNTTTTTTMEALSSSSLSENTTNTTTTTTTRVPLQTKNETPLHQSTIIPAQQQAPPPIITNYFTQELDKTLKNILDTILSEAMARDVIHGNYEPKLERVDIQKLLQNSITNTSTHGATTTTEAPNNNKKEQRFPIIIVEDDDVHNDNDKDTAVVPLVLRMDPQLLQYIYRNAISNACKYGQTNGVVRTYVRYDESSEVFTMEVTNRPGPQHDRLLALGPDVAARMVFEPGRRLHHRNNSNNNRSINTNCGTSSTTSPTSSSTNNNNTDEADNDNDDNDQFQQQQHQHSAGDGAWIMRKCALTMQGTVGIRFERDETTFSFSCPAVSGNIRHVNFQLPPNAWGVAIDDSKIQRKLLSKFMTHLGISPEHQVIQGSSSAEIHNFGAFLIQLLREHRDDYFLVVVDENLDVLMDNTTNGETTCSMMSNLYTVSGSECIERVRQRLTEEEEQRLLALIRSANDSGQDITLYKRRAHGFISKAPIRHASIIETIAPLWEERFRHLLPTKTTTQPNSSGGGGGATAATSTNIVEASYRHQTRHFSPQSMNDFLSMVVKELQSNLDFVDDIVLVRCHNNNNNNSSLADGGKEEGVRTRSQRKQNNNNNSINTTTTTTTGHHISSSNTNNNNSSSSWPLIWEKLHGLKGDLLSLFNDTPLIEKAVSEINRMRGPELPHNFELRWRELRNQISEITSVLGSSSSQLLQQQEGNNNNNNTSTTSPPPPAAGASQQQQHQWNNKRCNSGTLVSDEKLSKKAKSDGDANSSDRKEPIASSCCLPSVVVARKKHKR